MTKWTTQMPPEYTRPYGVEEVHAVYLAPAGWPGKGPTVSLGIPECELIFCAPGVDGELVTMVNRPKTNFSIARWLRFACDKAIEQRASIAFHCDTAEQAEQAARRATRWLPGYRRIALERMADASTRVADKLS